MSQFSDNMATASPDLDTVFGETATVTPKGGSAASIVGRLGPVRVDEDDDDGRRGRKLTRTFSFLPSNGPDASFVDGTLTDPDSVVWHVESIPDRTASRITLKLVRHISTERTGRGYRMGR